MTSSVSRRILAVSGSLRAKSINTAVLQAMQSMAPPDLTVILHPGLGDLPHFNPDLDLASPPAAVAAWRDAVDSASAMVICTPEYAHGIPGTLKNALDWLVSHELFLNKPVAVLNARPEAGYAQASLREILSAMNARLLDEASVTLPLTSNTLDAAALVALPAIRSRLNAALTALAIAVATT
jgi:NAD(P)H-dependent FMN reductase